jgi:hypothetical protein
MSLENQEYFWYRNKKLAIINISLTAGFRSRILGRLSMKKMVLRSSVITLIMVFFGQVIGLQPGVASYSPSISLNNGVQTPQDTLVFSDDFSTQKAWIDQSNGMVNRDNTNAWLSWQARRDTPIRYFIPVNITTDFARFDFRFKVIDAAGNGSVHLGLAETLEAPSPIWGLQATGFFVALNRDTLFGTKVAMLSLFSDGSYSGVDSEVSTINYTAMNTWRRLRVVIDQGDWTITLFDDNWDQMSQMSGTLPQQHSAYRYLLMDLEGTSGWEWETGLVDEVNVYGTPNTVNLFTDDFSTQKAWVNESAGYFYRDASNEWLVWQTYRDQTRRYWITLPAFSGRDTIRLRFRVKVNSAAGNGSVGIGLFENLSGAYNQSSAPVGFNLHINHNTLGIDHVYPWVTYTDRDVYGSWVENDPATYTNLGAMNVWRRVELSIVNLNWTIAAYDDNGNFLDDLSGTLPQAHYVYRYLMIFMDYCVGWETQAGYLDDIELEVNKPATTGSDFVEEFDSADSFTSTSPNVTISGGLANWNVSRSPAGYQQYVYRSIPEITGDVRLMVRGRINSASNNCGIHAGIGTQPGNGLAVTYGFYGGGCAMHGPVITGRGVTLDHQEEPPGCIFTGNWLWVNYNTMYTAILEIVGGVASLGVNGVGMATGIAQYTGPFNMLYVGMTGDGDWPTCSGAIDSITIEKENKIYLPIIQR